MRHRLALLSLLFVSCAVITPQARLTWAADDIPVGKSSGSRAADRKILRTMQEFRVVGLSFIAVKRNRIVARGCYGYANLEKRTPTNEKTVYRIASISKPFVATAIMRLIESGRCNLDDDVGSYLGFELRNPAYPARPITVRHLLTHTSSLCDGGRYDDFLEASYGTQPPSIRELVLPDGAFYKPNLWRATVPGRDFYYTNLGFELLATIVEKITGTHFDEYCRGEIFEPLKMDASFNVAHFKNVDSFAVLYSRTDPSAAEKNGDTKENGAAAGERQNGYEPAIDNYNGSRPAPRDFSKFEPGYNAVMHSPQGGVRASAAELAKFMFAQMNGGKYADTRILQRRTVRLMQREHWAGRRHNGLYRRNALGFHITRNLVKGKQLIGHSGRAYGFQGMMYFDPESRSGIILMMNGGEYDKYDRGPMEFHTIETRLYRLLYARFVRK